MEFCSRSLLLQLGLFKRRFPCELFQLLSDLLVLGLNVQQIAFSSVEVVLIFSAVKSSVILLYDLSLFVEKFALLGRNISVPSNITGTKEYEKEEVIAICDAEEMLDCCPKCQGDVPFGTIMIVTENYRLLPVNCCNRMHWFRASDGFGEEWA